jgi:hypothetical protein
MKIKIKLFLKLNNSIYEKTDKHFTCKKRLRNYINFKRKKNPNKFDLALVSKELETSYLNDY